MKFDPRAFRMAILPGHDNGLLGACRPYCTREFQKELDFWLTHGFELSDILNVRPPAGNAPA